MHGAAQGVLAMPGLQRASAKLCCLAGVMSQDSSRELFATQTKLPWVAAQRFYRCGRFSKLSKISESLARLKRQSVRDYCSSVDTPWFAFGESLVGSSASTVHKAVAEVGRQKLDQIFRGVVHLVMKLPVLSA